MKHRPVALLLALLLALSLLVAGCAATRSTPAPAAPSPAPAAPEPKVKKESVYPLTLTDDAGRSVTIKAEPKRVISVAPSNTELLFALGKGGSLVGRSDFDDFPAEVKQIPSIGGFFPPDYEKILALKPDLILLIDGSPEAREKLTREYQITTFVVQPKNFPDLYRAIRTLGQVLNGQEKAEQLAASMEKQVSEIKAKAGQATTRPVVFYEVWPEPLMTAGPGTFIDDMITLAGGVNAAAAAKEPWPQFPLEQLVAADPEVIIARSPDAAKAAAARKGWESLRAVKSGKVLPIPDENLAVRPGPRLVEGLKWIAAQIHPEIFKP